jgi:hypothetical protein
MFPECSFFLCVLNGLCPAETYKAAVPIAHTRPLPVVLGVLPLYLCPLCQLPLRPSFEKILWINEDLPVIKLSASILHCKHYLKKTNLFTVWL